MKAAVPLIVVPLLASGLVAGLGVRFWGGSRGETDHPESNGFYNIVPPPPQSAQQAERGRVRRNKLRNARRLSESGHPVEALRLLDENAREMSPSQRAWAVVNDRAWSDAFLRGRRYAAILDAYESPGGDPHGEVPPVVVVADLESDGKMDLNHNFSRATVARPMGKDIVDDLPSDGTKKGLLALAYLAIGRDYHAEANFEAPRWYFEQAARLAPGDPFCAWSLATVLIEEGRYTDALAVLRRARPARTAGLRERIEEDVRIASYGLSSPEAAKELQQPRLIPARGTTSGSVALPQGRP